MPPTPRTRPTRDELTRLSREENMSQRAIARHFGWSFSRMKEFFKEYGIEGRKSGWAKHPGRDKEGTPHLSATQAKHPGRAELDRLYNDEMLSHKRMGQRLGVSEGTVRAWCKAEAIAARPGNWGAKLDIAAAEYEFLPDQHLDDPDPVPPPGKRKRERAAKRAFLRLSETERRIVARRVDEFLIYAQVRQAA